MRLKGGPENFRDKYFLRQDPPYKCLWTVPYENKKVPITILVDLTFKFTYTKII